MTGARTATAVYKALELLDRAVPMPARTKRAFAGWALVRFPWLREAGLLARTARGRASPAEAAVLATARARQSPGLLVAPRTRALVVADDPKRAARLRKAGWEVTLVCDAATPGLDHDAVQGMQALAVHLLAEGGSYSCALLCSPAIMFDYAPLVRALAPNAALVYDAPTPADQPLEQANRAAADLVLERDAAEDALRALGARGPANREDWSRP